MIRVLDIVEDTMVDGPGLRTSIYCAGCDHRCPGCHNPQSWEMQGGYEASVEDIMTVIEADPYANVTFSGGDPMFQPEAFCELAETIRSRTHKDIWCYTGFTFEVLLNMPRQRRLLQLCDVIVDGPYVEHLRDTDLPFRGSSNQRIIDVAASLLQEQVVLWHDPMSIAS